MITKPLKDIVEQDIEALITNAVPEGKTIEYKRDLPGDNDAAKKEFLADVSSFANTIGGDLIFGVDEAQGVPTAVVGVAMPDRDQEIRRLDSILSSGLEPRIRHEIQPVVFSDGRQVLIMRAERSWIGPHRVVFKASDKFYGRTSAGKYPLDVSELRTAFGFSQGVVERIRAFRADRAIALAHNETPIPFLEGGKTILHCIPFQSFAGTNDLDISPWYRQPHKLWVMNGSGWSHRINLDGLVTFANGSKGSYSYTQLFRNGIVESVEGTWLNREYETRRMIPSGLFEKELLSQLPKCLQLLSELGVQPPIAVALTLVNVRGVRMATHAGINWRESDPITQQHLILPETIVNDMNEKPTPILRPIFDLVWNACGFAESENFDPAGNFRNR